MRPRAPCLPPPPLQDEAGAEQLARWFSLWAVNAKHDAEALAAAAAADKGKGRRRSGGGAAAPSSAAGGVGEGGGGGATLELELLPDEHETRATCSHAYLPSMVVHATLVRCGAEGAAARAACCRASLAPSRESHEALCCSRSAAPPAAGAAHVPQVQLARELGAVVEGVLRALPPTPEACQAALAGLQQRAAAADAAELAALGPAALALLRCCVEAQQVVEAAEKCLPALKEQVGGVQGGRSSSVLWFPLRLLLPLRLTRMLPQPSATSALSTDVCPKLPCGRRS